MSDITLTAGVRANLLSLQNTAQLLNTTQNRLATGKKVNTAFDNPSSFFTSQSLNNRASSLSQLLDQIGQAQQTLQAANTGLTSLTSLLQQALSIAQQALPAAGHSTLSYSAITTNGSLLASETFGKVASATTTLTSNGSLGAADTLSIVDAGTTYSVTLAAADTISTIITKVNGTSGLGTGGALSASTDSTGHLQIVSNDSSQSITVNDITGGALLTTANTVTTGHSTDLYQLLNGNGGFTSGDTLTVAVNGGAAQNISIGTASGQVQTLAQLQSSLQALSGISSATASGSAVSLNVATSTGNSTTRGTLQSNYNALLTQLDQLAGDASYKGVNLLNGDNLAVIFNENSTSSLTIQGVTFNSAGLGLFSISGTGFQANGNINNTITSINTAISSVQAQTETLGTNASTIQIRQDFTKNLINTLQTGSDNLVLADQNLESANLLTLQTRQQLSISALSISNQTQQAVLKLFP